jgi:hypothetical protein
MGLTAKYAPGVEVDAPGREVDAPIAMSYLSTDLVDYSHLTPSFAPCQPPLEESSGEPRRSRAIDRERDRP